MAFRIAKSKIEIRPMFHFMRRCIEAHICICFVALKGITCKSVWLCINSCEPKKEEPSVNNSFQLRSELLNFSIKRFCCSIC